MELYRSTLLKERARRMNATRIKLPTKAVRTRKAAMSYRRMFEVAMSDLDNARSLRRAHEQAGTF
eukprot:4327503-Alexandrium_andersonii.AAC.1